MKRSWWRTGPPIQHQQPIAPLSGGQLLRQVIVLALVLAIWGGGLALFLSALPTAIATPLAQVPPTVTSMPVPTNTAVPAAPTATRAPAATPTSRVSATIEPAATITPSATPTTAAATATPVGTDGKSVVSFQADVLPVFKQVCSKCHGGDKVEEGLSLLTYADVMRGSDNGPVIVPGDAANSLLAQQVESGEMPKRGPKLLPKQIQAIVEWIDAGAPDN